MLSKNLQANSVYCCQSNVSHAHLRMFSKIEFHSKHSNEASCSQRRFATPLSLVDKILLDVNIWDLPGIYFSDQHVIDTLNNKKQRHIYNFISIARHTHFSLITDQLRYEKGCGTARHLIRKVGYEKYHAHRNHCFKQSDWVNYLRGRIIQISVQQSIHRGLKCLVVPVRKCVPYTPSLQMSCIVTSSWSLRLEESWTI